MDHVEAARVCQHSTATHVMQHSIPEILVESCHAVRDFDQCLWFLSRGFAYVLCIPLPRAGLLGCSQCHQGTWTIDMRRRIPKLTEQHRPPESVRPLQRASRPEAVLVGNV